VSARDGGGFSTQSGQVICDLRAQFSQISVIGFSLLNRWNFVVQDLPLQLGLNICCWACLSMLALRSGKMMISRGRC
jgi:hypothetical protein